MLGIRFDSTTSRSNNFMEGSVCENVFCEAVMTARELGSMTVNVDVMGFDTETYDDYGKIGELVFSAFGRNSCNLNPYAKTFDKFDHSGQLGFVMDADGDTYECYKILEKMYSKIRIDPVVCDVDEDVHIICFHRFFINPEYRDKGVGKCITQNLSKILYTAANIKPLYVVGVLAPDDKTDETKKIQKKTMKSAKMILGKHNGQDVFAGCIFDEELM